MTMAFPSKHPVITLFWLELIASAQAVKVVDFRVTSKVTDPKDTAQHFVARISTESVIPEARQELNKTDGFKIMAGIIETTPVDWNPRWSFHFIPETVFFGELFIEVCDSSTSYIEEHLEDVGGAFLPGNQWCPWGTRVLEELQELNLPNATDLPTAAPTLSPIIATGSPTASSGSATLQVSILGNIVLLSWLKSCLRTSC